MPELPEVETMRTFLLPYCKNNIDKVEVKNISFRKKVNLSFAKDVANTFIEEINRIGKFLIFKLSNNKYMLIHAGMSGKFIINTNNKLEENSLISKHNHIVFHLHNGIKINYNDPRRFGLVQSFNTKEELMHSLNLGVDALSNKLTEEYLSSNLKKTNCDIKTFLLNQKIIAGIGNIYACEILFYSGIHPLSNCKKIKKTQVELLVNYTKEILAKSVKLGGSTLKDYQKPNGETGYFQNTFAVYSKGSKPCINCGTEIEQIKIKGRSTYFCPKEQKIYD